MNLLLEIARCPNVITCVKKPSEQHPCSQVIASQKATSLDSFHVPEPWNGLIEQAPLLFISSNPSFNRKEEFPLWSWDESLIEDYFTHRFGGGKKLWVKDGVQGLLRKGGYADVTPFWEAVMHRATELFERPVKPGVDYALTEVVHCKSRRQKGVDEALEECSQRYLKRVLEISGANLIVVLGATARKVVKDMFSISPRTHLSDPIVIKNMARIFVFLPHPNAYQPNTFSENFSAEELKQIQAHLFKASQ